MSGRSLGGLRLLSEPILVVAQLVHAFDTCRGRDPALSERTCAIWHD